jgi:hypothetical protein
VTAVLAMGDEEKETPTETPKNNLNNAILTALKNFENCFKKAHKNFTNASIENFKQKQPEAYNTLSAKFNKEIIEPIEWLEKLSTLTQASADEALDTTFKNALMAASISNFRLPDSLIKEWDIKIEPKLSKQNTPKAGDSTSSDEEFSDAFDEIKEIPKDQKFFLRALATSIRQNKDVKIETLKFPSQNVVDWFEKFELLTTRWSNKERGYEVVRYLEEIALTKYQLLKTDKFDYEKIKDHLIKELRPKFSTRSLMADFFCAKQKSEESIDTYAHRLLGYIKQAKTDQKNLFENELGDVFRNGCDKRIKNFLLSENSSDFNTLWVLAKQLEKNVDELEETSINAIKSEYNSENSINKQSESEKRAIPETKFCHFCGKNNHFSVDCREMKRICDSLKGTRINSGPRRPYYPTQETRTRQSTFSYKPNPYTKINQKSERDTDKQGPSQFRKPNYFNRNNNLNE